MFHNLLCYLTKPLVVVVTKITLGTLIANLITRLSEHGYPEDQPIYQHLSKCEQISYVIDLLRWPDINVSTAEISNKHHFANAVMSTYCNLDTWFTWFQLLFLEAFYFKYLAPKINDGLKIIRDFVLFR